jgi:hypothetical protein
MPCKGNRKPYSAHDIELVSDAAVEQLTFVFMKRNAFELIGRRGPAAPVFCLQPTYEFSAYCIAQTR